MEPYDVDANIRVLWYKDLLRVVRAVGVRCGGRQYSVLCSVFRERCDRWVQPQGLVEDTA